MADYCPNCDERLNVTIASALDDFLGRDHAIIEIVRHAAIGESLCVWRLNSHLYVSNGMMFIRVPENHTIFDSRSWFPIIPDEGQFIRSGKVTAKGAPPHWINEQMALATQPVTRTFWYHDRKSWTPIEAFLLPDNTLITLQKQFTDCFSDDLVWTGSGQDQMVVVRDKDHTLYGAVMPLHGKSQPAFPMTILGGGQ